MYDPIHKPFLALHRKGKVDSKLSVVDGRIENNVTTMGILIDVGCIHITKEQAMAFFGLIEPTQSKPNDADLDRFVAAYLERNRSDAEPKKQMTIGQLWDQLQEITQCVQEINESWSLQGLEHRQTYLATLRNQVLSL